MLVLFLAVTALPSLAADHPDLVVVISIDQFRYDYTTRFEPYFSPDGFRRFLDRGATFTRAKYSYSTTYTGPGHSAIGTGRVPAETGIIANTWFDRLKRAPEYCVADERAGGFSPVNLQSDSLGDRLQEHDAGARVFGVAIKDRAAILMAGRKGTAAYWFDPNTSGFTSSTYYHSNATLISEYNKTIPDYLRQHPVWEQSTFIPAADLLKLTHDPERVWKFKTRREGLGVSFPHPIRAIDALTYTPFGNGLVIGFVERLIDAEKIGAGGTPDLLFVGLSSPDYLGHNFGPDSLEVADSVVRTDRDVADFLHWLDARFALRYVAVVTSDHGVQSIPEVARDMGRDAGRVSMRNPGANIRTLAELAEIAPARVDLEKKAGALLGRHLTGKNEVSDGLILFFEEPAIYFNWTRIAELKLDGEKVKRAYRDAALKLKGVSGAFTNSELLKMIAPSSDLEAAVRRSFRADRSGDVIMTLKPGYIWDYSGTGTTHGQAIEDDQHVPLMFWGRGIVAGHFDEEAAPTDIARTIAAMFGFDAGGASSRVLPISPAQR